MLNRLRFLRRQGVTMPNTRSPQRPHRWLVGLFVLLCVTGVTSNAVFADENVGIGTAKPDNSAVLDVSIETLARPRGVLFPRMTQQQRDSILLPAKGLLVYNTTTEHLEINTGTAIVPVWAQYISYGTSSGADWSISGNDAINPAVNFLGTKNPVALIFKTNNLERLRVQANGFVGIGTAAPTQLFSVGSSSQFTVDSNGFMSTLFGIQLRGPNAELRLNNSPGIKGDLVVSQGAATTPIYTKQLDSLSIDRLNSQTITTKTLTSQLIVTDSLYARAANIVKLTSTDITVNNNLTVNNTLTTKTLIVDSIIAKNMRAALPLDSVLSGTSTNKTLNIGNGTVLGPTGGGTIRANAFTGPGSTSDSVDLQSEVSGILPAKNGGMGIDVSNAAVGQIPIGTGNGLALDSLHAGKGIAINTSPGHITIQSTSAEVGPGARNNSTLRYDSTRSTWVENQRVMADTLGNISVAGVVSSNGVRSNGNIVLSDPSAQFVTGGTSGQVGQILASGGISSSPSWTSSLDSLEIKKLKSTSISSSSLLVSDSLRALGVSTMNTVNIDSLRSRVISNTQTIVTDSLNVNKLKLNGVLALDSAYIKNLGSNTVSSRTVIVSDSLSATKLHAASADITTLTTDSLSTRALRASGNSALNTVSSNSITNSGLILSSGLQATDSVSTKDLRAIGRSVLYEVWADSLSSREISNSGTIRTDSLYVKKFKMAGVMHLDSAVIDRLSTTDFITERLTVTDSARINKLNVSGPTTLTTVNSTTINNSGDIITKSLTVGDTLKTKVIEAQNGFITGLSSDSISARTIRISGNSLLNDVMADSLSSRQIRNSETIVTDSLFANKFKLNGTLNADSVYVNKLGANNATINNATVNNATVNVANITTALTDSISARALRVSGNSNLNTVSSTTINNSANVSTATLSASDSILTNKLHATGNSILTDVWADSIASRQIRNSETIWTDSLYANKFKLNGTLNADSVYVNKLGANNATINNATVNNATVNVANITTALTDSISARALRVSGNSNLNTVSSTTINNSGNVSTATLSASDSILTNKLHATGNSILTDVWTDSIASRQIRNSETIWTDSLYANKFKLKRYIER